MVSRPGSTAFCRMLFIGVSLGVMAPGCDDKPRSEEFGDDGDTDTVSDLPLAAGVTMTEIELYQAVRIPVMADGEPAGDSGVTVVAGKDAFVRVYVEYASDFEPRELYLHVALEGDGATGSANALIDVTDEMIATASILENVASTLNLLVPGDVIQGGRTLVVSILEASDDAGGSGDTSGAIWPADGGYDPGIAEEQPPTKLVLVPVEYNADGSGRLPDTSNAQLQVYADLFSAMYPISDIKITVDDPMPYGEAVSPLSGAAWSGLLDAVTQRHNDNGAGPDEFYYGLVVPEDSFGEFCGGGCITGMSWLSPAAGAQQVGTGIGFTGSQSAYTAAHEVGHAHGRNHAPGCGAAGPYDGYPYSDGTIGVPGYDPTESTPDMQKFKGESAYYDIMSYCTPQWISDFMYMGLYGRVEEIGSLADADVSLPPGAGTVWRSVVFRSDRAIAEGPTLDSALPPAGEQREVELLDGDGAVIDTAAGFFVPYSDLDGGMISFREPPFDVTAVRIAGHPAVTLE